MTQTVEANIDGLVGPTHNYAGLSFGNIASEKHAQSVSNPKQAALQGVAKMKFLHGLGMVQLILPPQPRPDWRNLHKLGYRSLGDVPAGLLNQLYSASSMWAANAATVSAACDTADGKVHITPANLISKFHRAVEPPVTSHYLRHIFPGSDFIHHAPLPPHEQFSDEGAANHMRLGASYDEPGLDIFVYGGASKKYPSRQSRASFEAIARLHGLAAERTVFLKQSAEAIDAGVFHNDVIAMSNGPLFIYHEKAYAGFDERLKRFTCVVISEKELPLTDVVSTYFFNSQLITIPKGGMAIIAPRECEENPKSRAVFERLMRDGHIAEIYYLDVRESMKNGGGPACLRLRVPVTGPALKSIHTPVLFSDVLYDTLCGWIAKHYRDTIHPDDLRDPALAEESKRALEELSNIIQIPIPYA